MLDWGVDLFWFEAFDEPGKANAIGDNGQEGKRAALGCHDLRQNAQVRHEMLDKKHWALQILRYR